jgi:hypothetical protein
MYYTNVVGYKLRILIDLLKYDNIMSSKVWQSFDIKRGHFSKIYPLLCYDQNKKTRKTKKMEGTLYGHNLKDLFCEQKFRFKYIFCTK